MHVNVLNLVFNFLKLRLKRCSCIRGWQCTGVRQCALPSQTSANSSYGNGTTERPHASQWASKKEPSPERVQLRRGSRV